MSDRVGGDSWGWPARGSPARWVGRGSEQGLASSRLPPTRRRTSSLVVLNAAVYTMDPGLPKAEAFAVRNGRFVAVGRSADIKGLAGKSTQTLDAKGMTIVPGFTDCHNHCFGTVLLYEVLVGNPFQVEFVTIASIVDKLRAKAKETPPGTWVEGYFYDDTKVKDKRRLTAKDLDAVSLDHPVVVHHRGGHTGFYNSKALEMAGVTKNTPNPPGGTFDRDDSGRTERPRHGPGDGRVREGGQSTCLHAGAAGTARPRRAGAHLQAVRPLRADQRPPRGGQPRRLQQVRARGELLHRVSYEPDGACSRR